MPLTDKHGSFHGHDLAEAPAAPDDMDCGCGLRRVLHGAGMLPAADVGRRRARAAAAISPSLAPRPGVQAPPSALVR
jgi:hypothetical protein